MNGVGEENGGGRGLIAGGERAVGVLKTQLLQAVTGTKVSDKRATECGDIIRGGGRQEVAVNCGENRAKFDFGWSPFFASNAGKLFCFLSGAHGERTLVA
jgi:hypothetical protein